MSSSFTIDKAQIVGLFLESVFFGIFLITFPSCIRALIWSDGRFKRPSTIQWPMLFVAIVLAVFATLDTALGLLHNIQAFVLYKGPGGAIEEFTNVSDWVNVMKTVDIVFPIVIGDAVLIYRCWIVYSKSYRVILGPFMIWLGSVVTAIWMIVLETTLRARVSLQVSQLKPVITASTILTLVQNLITTALIIWRIWIVDRENSRYLSKLSATVQSNPSEKTKGPGSTPILKTTRLQRVMRIVIESGLLLAIAAVVSAGTYIADSNAFNAVTDAEVQIIAIAFNLIIIRAKNQTADEYANKHTHTTMPIAFGQGPVSESESGVDSELGTRTEYVDVVIGGEKVRETDEELGGRTV